MESLKRVRSLSSCSAYSGTHSYNLPLTQLLKKTLLTSFKYLTTEGILHSKDKQSFPVMIFCLTGQISGAMAIKLQMDTNSTFNKEIASAYVMTKRYELKDM